MAFFFFVDYIFFKALKDIIKGLQFNTQRWIIVAYWAIPVVLILGYIYLFLVAPETSNPKYKRFFWSCCDDDLYF